VPASGSFATNGNVAIPFSSGQLRVRDDDDNDDDDDDVAIPFSSGQLRVQAGYHGLGARVRWLSLFHQVS